MQTRQYNVNNDDDDDDDEHDKGRSGRSKILRTKTFSYKILCTFQFSTENEEGFYEY